MREEEEQEQKLEKMKTKIIIEKLEDKRQDPQVEQVLDSEAIDDIVKEVEKELTVYVKNKMIEKKPDNHFSNRINASENELLRVESDTEMDKVDEERQTF